MKQGREATRNIHDEVSCLSYPFFRTRPDRLAVLATLSGMTPAPVEDCRVLEIGCGDGANLTKRTILNLIIPP